MAAPPRRTLRAVAVGVLQPPAWCAGRGSSLPLLRAAVAAYHANTGARNSRWARPLLGDSDRVAAPAATKPTAVATPSAPLTRRYQRGPGSNAATKGIAVQRANVATLATE